MAVEAGRVCASLQASEHLLHPAITNTASLMGFQDKGPIAAG